MDPNLYNAAMEGKVDVLEQYSTSEQLEGQLTVPNKNTILHVAAQFGHFQFVEAILEVCPFLLRRLNSKGENALHVAAREGYSEIVQALIKRAKEVDKGDVESGSTGGVAAKEMLRAINYEDEDTALHMAVRNGHGTVVRLLTTEDPELTHKANKADETPLYLAAEGGPKMYCYGFAVYEILYNCPSSAYSGPGGRTALHAAALFDKTGITIDTLLNWKKDLIKETDAHGWTPLHCAARAQNVKGVERLLESEKSAAYVRTADEDEGKTALHIAAALNCTSVMEKILLHCPDCWEVVNSKRQNVLHVALEMESLKSFELISKKPWSRHLINQKDNKGNTPLHLIAEFSPKPKLYSQVSKILENIKHDLETLANWYVFNNQNMSPSDVRLFTEQKDFIEPREGIGSGRNTVIATIDHPNNITKWKIAREKKELLEEKIQADREEAEKKEEAAEEKEEAKNMKKIGDTHLIVATLIATVTFAASFTMPGGYNSNLGSEQGTLLLLKETAFKAFVVTNTIALICSISSVLLYMTAAIYGVDSAEFMQRKLAHRYLSALILNLIAMAAMVIAFITGSYSILSHEIAIAISVCAIACFSFLIYFFEIGKYFYIY